MHWTSWRGSHGLCQDGTLGTLRPQVSVSTQVFLLLLNFKTLGKGIKSEYCFRGLALNLLSSSLSLPSAEIQEGPIFWLLS